jgi:hypothetical protein
MQPAKLHDAECQSAMQLTKLSAKVSLTLDATCHWQ